MTKRKKLCSRCLGKGIKYICSVEDKPTTLSLNYNKARGKGVTIITDIPCGSCMGSGLIKYVNSRTRDTNYSVDEHVWSD